MNREIHVRFWESAGVRFRCATQPCPREAVVSSMTRSQKRSMSSMERPLSRSDGDGIAFDVGAQAISKRLLGDNLSRSHLGM